MALVVYKAKKELMNGVGGEALWVYGRIGGTKGYRLSVG